jgi:hypothetical protein
MNFQELGYWGMESINLVQDRDSGRSKTGTSESHPPKCVIPDDVLIQFGPPDDEHLCSKHVEA